MAHRLSKTQERALSKLRKFGKWLSPWELHERITTLEALHDRELVDRKYGENSGLYPNQDTFYRVKEAATMNINDLEAVRDAIANIAKGRDCADSVEADGYFEAAYNTLHSLFAKQSRDRLIEVIVRDEERIQMQREGRAK